MPRNAEIDWRSQGFLKLAGVPSDRGRNCVSRGLTLPSRGRPTSGFAGCRPPLMTNVRALQHISHTPMLNLRFLLAAVLSCLSAQAGAGVLDRLGGTWDTVPIYRGGCESDTYFHTIEVSPDKGHVTFKHLKPIPGPNGPIQQYSYKVLYE